MRAIVVIGMSSPQPGTFEVDGSEGIEKARVEENGAVKSHMKRDSGVDVKEVSEDREEKCY